MTSTLRSAGTAFLRTIVSSASTSRTSAPGTDPESVTLTAVKSIYPSLSAFHTENPSTVSLPAALSDTAYFARPSLRPEVADAASSSGRFVFGSPVKEAACATGSKAFTFTMPGTLTASMGSTTMEEVEDPKPTAVESVMEEMTRRAAEARALAETSGIKRSSSLLLGSLAASSTQPATQGKRAVFEASHKRTFDRMDSITNHWAAKRSIYSTSDLAGLTRSDSRSKISDEGAEPQAKRLKPAVTNQSTRGSERDNKVVARLRESGWSSAADERMAPSVADSLSSGVASLTRSRKEVKAGEQAASLSEQARRKRQLELAKARRKSGAVNGIGLSKRRPSLGVGREFCFAACRRLSGMLTRGSRVNSKIISVPRHRKESRGRSARTTTPQTSCHVSGHTAWHPSTRDRPGKWRSVDASLRCSDGLNLFPCGFDGGCVAYPPAKHTQPGEARGSQEVRLAGESEAADHLAQPPALAGSRGDVDELQSCREARERRREGGAACVRTIIFREAARFATRADFAVPVLRSAARSNFAVLVLRSGTRRYFCGWYRTTSQPLAEHLVLAASRNHETTFAADHSATADEHTWPQADNGQEDRLCVEPERPRVGEGRVEKAARSARVARAEGARQSRGCKGARQTHLTSSCASS